MTLHSCFATVAAGLEELLAAELASLGAVTKGNTRGGVHFEADTPTAYRVCLWSRLAGRILCHLHSFAAPDEEALYAAARAVAWEEHLDLERTFAVDCTARKPAIGHTRFAALRVKDAIVDRFRDRQGARPAVRVERPDLQIHLYLEQDQGRLYLDLSGESLHRRGYRLEGGMAPLRETLAAAILARCDWAALAAQNRPFVDPMCGSGTLVLEAVQIAADVAPGLNRDYFGFLGWLQHDRAVWEELHREALARRDEGLERSPRIFGFDQDPRAIKNALANARRAGLDGVVTFHQRSLRDLSNPLGAAGAGPGLIVVNPPYGARLGTPEELAPVYRELGTCWTRHFAGWEAALLTSEKMLAFQVGYRAHRQHAFMNGPLACQLYHFHIDSSRRLGEPDRATLVRPEALEQAQMFVNRLRKNRRRLRPWLRREGIACYRLYDRDLPEYALAVDIYGEAVHVQEYRAPASVDQEKSHERLQAALAVLPEALGVDTAQVHCKTREPQKGASQYRRREEKGETLQVSEGGLSFLVNLTDYLDTGLFLDHRITRGMLREFAAGKRFLNLFCYTATATVYAAAGGAVATTSVDLSRTYLDWARSNLALNGLTGPEHRLVQADCMGWLKSAEETFDLIFVDPPTFSNSKRMEEVFDVQRDHVELLHLALDRLAPGGKLIFSTNFRQFRLDQAALAHLEVVDLSARTLPEDFARNPRIHQAWLLTKKGDPSLRSA